jgi:hypothetical protein
LNLPNFCRSHNKNRISFLNITFLAGIAIALVGCAGFQKRKECEKVNWFEHGFQVAMKGKKLASDSLAGDCVKVEALVRFDELDKGFKAGMAKYCIPETAYSMGREGSHFSFENCEEKLPALRAQHKKGVTDFCRPESAYQAGVKGWEYNNICPKETEDAFLNRYRKGRQVFLNVEIDKLERDAERMEDEARRLERDQTELRYQLSYLSRNVVIRKETSRDRFSKKEKIEIGSAADEYDSRRNDLEWRIRNLQHDINAKYQKRDEIKNQIGKYRAEAIQLMSYGEGQ